MPKLVVFRGDAVANELRLAGQTVTVGRDTSNKLVLDDSLKGVSRFHAEVRAEGGTYVIVDLKSRNGIWMNGRRIKDKATLALGVPVTVGAYELVLEDDVSSGEFVEAGTSHPRTEVNTTPPEVARPAAWVTQLQSILSTTPSRQVLMWSGVAVATLVLVAATFAVFRYAPWRATPTEVSDPPPSPPPAPTALPGPAALEVPRQEEAITAHLAAARVNINDRDYAGALRDHIKPVLWFDPQNQEALDLKKQAEGKPPPPPLPPPPPVGVDCPERPGIPKRPNESCGEYGSRAQGIIVNFQEGTRYLEIPDYANAIARFRLVDSAQKGYRDVDTLITETLEKQRRMVELAISNGQQNEQAGILRDARTWYQTALATDPGSTAARDRLTALVNKMNTDATKLLNSASYNRKAGIKETARKQLQQILDTMLSGDDVRIRAEKEMEALKR